MEVVRVALKGSANNLHKGNAASVVGVNVRVNFKDKTAKLDLVGADHSLLGLLGLRTGGYFGEAVQEFPHPEIIQCGPKKHRLQLPAQVQVTVKLRIHSSNQFQLLAQGFGCRFSDAVHEFWAA